MKLSESSILKWMRTKTQRPLKVSEMAKCFAIPDEQRREFRNWIKQMAQDGTLIRLKGGRYGLPDEMNLMTGVLQGHPDGYGFVVSETPGPDVYIGRRSMKDAMHLDKVVVRLESGLKDSRPEGRIVRVMERNTQTLVGLFEAFGRDGWVVPSEPKYFHDIFVPHKHRNGAKTGHRVLVELTDYPTQNHMPMGRVLEVMGDSRDPRVEVLSVLRKFGIREAFPEEVLRDVEDVSPEIDDRELSQRKDLRGELLFTIDGEKAKDFDDAVSLEKMGDHFRLGVHIADVAHFVQEGSPLDEEAYERGTSVYFPDEVVPMLPFKLSNDLCSLKPGVDRLALSVFIDFDPAGKVAGYSVCESVIKSRHRFTYTEVARLLDEGDTDGAYPEAFPMLQLMHRLSQQLRKNRFEQGSVDFNVPEATVVLDAEGKVRDIVVAEHNCAHELIEEFMLSANQVVARHLESKGVPLIHRIHETPDPDKLAAFNEFIKGFGLRLTHPKNPTSRDLQKLVQRVRGHPQERAVNTLLLRTMKKAVYSPKDPGHFCLGFKHYTHFTSPIRRYPDLIIHRLVKSFLRRKGSQKDKKRLLPRLADIAEQSSTMERKALEVEREMIDLRRAQFMEDKVGKTYSGSISGVTAFGFFVELQEVFVEGLVHVSRLTDDYYHFDEAEHTLKGHHRGKTYQIGDPVKIRVANVDIMKRQIDFTLLAT